MDADTLFILQQAQLHKVTILTHLYHTVLFCMRLPYQYPDISLPLVAFFVAQMH